MHDCLLPESLATVRKDTASVECKTFAEWSVKFVEFVRARTIRGRKVLLIYDGYRSNITALELEISEKGGTFSYCLPFQTSGKMQALDVGLYES